MAIKSYYNCSSTRPYLYTTLAELFDKHCRNTPEKEAFIFYDRDLRRTSVSFKQAYDDSLSLAAGLLKTYPDLRPGCRICVYTENKWEYLLSVIAAFRLGAAAALANIDEHNEEKLLKVIDQADCCGLIADVSRLENGKLCEVLAKRKGWIFTVSDDQSQILSDGVPSIRDLSEIGRKCYETRNKIVREQKEIDPDTGAAIFFTSGSTGEPKAILYSHFGFINSVHSISDILWNTHNDVHLHNSPFSHVSGFGSGLNISVYFGGSSVTVSKKLNTPSAESYTFLRLLEIEKVTTAILFGFVIYDLVHEPSTSNFDLSSLRMVATGGQILSEGNVETLLKRFPKMRLTHFYGLTEGFIASNTKGTDFLWMKIFPNVEVKLVDASNQVVPLNAPGEICIRSRFMMSGYMIGGRIYTGRDEHGWFHTDDNGMMNESGELFIIGRMSDIIIRGPSNVQVLPLEEILDSHPKVKKCAIVPVADPRLGYDLCACVIPADATVSETEILDWCSNKFGNDRNGVNLRPKCCIFMEEFPLTISGKISKPKLKEVVKERFGI